MVDYDKLYKEMLDNIAPKPDFSKGFTIGEWAKKMKGTKSACTIKRNMDTAVESGEWIKDNNFRVSITGVIRPVTVYRPKDWKP